MLFSVLLRKSVYRTATVTLSAVCAATLLSATIAQAESPIGATPALTSEATPNHGLVFKCSPDVLVQLEPHLLAYFAKVGVDPRFLVRDASRDDVLRYTLAPAFADGDTLTLMDRPELGLKEALIELPTATGKPRTVITVSKPEIVYAMLQTGRATTFTGAACDVQALEDQVGVRQNTVAWAETLSWNWPEGTAATWNKKYWKRGNPVKGFPLYEAVNDAFINQAKYGIGCYTATKLVVIQGVLDYYQRIKNDPVTLALVQANLLQDSDPLTNIEPGSMWSFEAGITSEDLVRNGKLRTLQHGVTRKNFIPGDWTYFLNTDPVSYEKTGYEGSNAIYLGRDKFDDYYNDHHHAYTYKEKLHEVYQWRNKVFSAHRDVAKVTPLSAGDLARLSQTPEQGGLLLELRAVPLQYGYEPFPVINPK
jgi:hypothetical protein